MGLIHERWIKGPIHACLLYDRKFPPRGLTVDSEGHLLIVQQGVGITSLILQDQGDDCLKVSEKVNVTVNANLTHGITLSGDGKTLFASSAEAVFSWPYDAVKSSASGIGSDKQKSTLIVSRGSQSDVDFDSVDLSTGHCQIKSFPILNSNTTSQNFNAGGKLLGWGLRNSVGIAEHPTTGGLYSVEMGMDYATRDGKNISQNNPGDEMNYHGIVGRANDLDQGLNHGYPYCQAAWDVEAIPNRGQLVVGNQFLTGDVNDTFTANDSINDAVCA